ncbi:hypothetical protein SAMN05421837_107392 [Amycolatopsis pretoriensis]|uniref:Uncharacterized protein n=1 Tax=Amycolatopsis pretoriensis TaxID=218821 RepID=A0A1H5R7U0_9PSEU|nr:hypothetical protein SAMN05421837_107392 [Amycolatopsis pretoriensis]
MPDRGNRVLRDEARPELISHWFYGRVVMHRVTGRYLERLKWRGMWLGVSECGRICRSPLQGNTNTVEWCQECYPGWSGS